MAQLSIEVILLRQWATYLAMPIWVMDEDGDLIFYNAPAEEILGLRFDEVGAVHADDLATVFETTGVDGEPMPNKELPVVIALSERRPAYARLKIKTFNHAWHDIEVSAFPIEGQGGRHLGAVAMFWESARP